MAVQVLAYSWLDRLIISAVEIWTDVDGERHVLELGHADVPLPAWADRQPDQLAYVAECILDMTYDRKRPRD